MKKIFYLILIIVMVFSLVSCGDDSEVVNSDDNKIIGEDSNSVQDEGNISDDTDEENSEDSSKDEYETDESSQETSNIDNSDLTAMELSAQSSEYYKSLENFEIVQDIYSGLIIYSDITAEPVIYATINSVKSTVFLNPFKFICDVNYRYLDGGNDNSLDGIIVNNINIKQYGKLANNTFDIYEKYDGNWNSINISQEEFIKNDNIGANYLTNFNYYFKNGQITGENKYGGEDVIVATYELTDEFAQHLFSNYGFGNFVKAEDENSIKEEILSAMEDSRANIYFDKTSEKIMYIEIINPGIVNQLRNIVAVNHIDDLSDETYVALIKSFQSLEIKSTIKPGAVNTDLVYELPEEALK